MVIRGFLPLPPPPSYESFVCLSGVNLSRISMSKSKVMCESTRIYEKYMDIVAHCRSSIFHDLIGHPDMSIDLQLVPLIM